MVQPYNPTLGLGIPLLRVTAAGLRISHFALHYLNYLKTICAHDFLPGTCLHILGLPTLSESPDGGPRRTQLSEGHS